MRRCFLMPRAVCLQAAVSLLAPACGTGTEQDRDKDVGGGQSGTDAQELSGTPYSGNQRRPGTCPLLALGVTASVSGLDVALDPTPQLVTSSSCYPVLSGNGEGQLAGKLSAFSFTVVFTPPPSPQPVHVKFYPNDGSASVSCAWASP